MVMEMKQVSKGETTHFQNNKSGIYPKFLLLYPCYSVLIPYSLTFAGASMYAIFHYVQILRLKHMSH